MELLSLAMSWRPRASWDSAILLLFLKHGPSPPQSFIQGYLFISVMESHGLLFWQNLDFWLTLVGPRPGLPYLLGPSTSIAAP